MPGTAECENEQDQGGGDAPPDGPPSQSAKAIAQQRNHDHADQRAAVLHPCQRSRFPDGAPVHLPGEGFQDQIRRAVGEHGDEDEDGEAPRVWLRPDAAQGGAEIRLGGHGCDGWRDPLTFNAPHGNGRKHKCE